MLNQVTGIWKFRSFLLALVRLDFRLKYKRSALGTGWALVIPLAMAATYVLVFSGVLGLSPATYATTVVKRSVLRATWCVHTATVESMIVRQARNSAMPAMTRRRRLDRRR